MGRAVSFDRLLAWVALLRKHGANGGGAGLCIVVPELFLNVRFPFSFFFETNFSCNDISIIATKNFNTTRNFRPFVTRFRNFPHSSLFLPGNTLGNSWIDRVSKLLTYHRGAPKDAFYTYA